MKAKGGAVPRRLPRPKPEPVIITPPQLHRSTGMCNLPVEPVPANAVPLIELGDNGCHWPVAGEGLATFFEPFKAAHSRRPRQASLTWINAGLWNEWIRKAHQLREL